MRLLHPMMPFLTEEVWQLLGQAVPHRGLPNPSAAAESVCIAQWPTANTSDQDPTIERQFAEFQTVLGALREIRQTHNIPPREQLSFSILCNQETADQLRIMQPYFTQMGKATAVWGSDAMRPDLSPRTLSGQHGPIELYIDLSQFIDPAAERKRLEKDRENVTKQIASIDGKLANKAFVDKAPPEVVQQQRDKLAELRGQLASIEAALARLAK
jgi:valyl-tRNA synthetase